MKNRQLQGIVSLIVTAALSFGTVAGTKALTQQIQKESAGTQGEKNWEEELDVTGSEGIVHAARTKDHTYQVTSKAKGYGGEITVQVTFDESADTILNAAVKEQEETPGVGSKITEDSFLTQFSGTAPPVSLMGTTAEADWGFPEGTVFADGTYENVWKTSDENGFQDQVRVVIEGGRIHSVLWDSLSADGQSKRKMSEEGAYQMTQDGLTWAEQAKAVEEAVVEDQSLERVVPDGSGKIDTVAGVSISVWKFASLTRSCLAQAAQLEGQTVPEAQMEEGSVIDGVSGATVSSVAVVKAVNQAWEFLKENRQMEGKS